MFNRLSALILKYPKVIISIIILLTGPTYWLAFISDYRVTVDFSLEHMFPEDDPEKDIYDNFISEFNREDDKILLVYDCPNPTSRKNITLISEIVESIEFDVEGVESVLSLGNLNNGDYFSDELTDYEWNLKVKELSHHPIYKNLIISSDGKTGALLIDLEDWVVGQDARLEILDDLYTVLDRLDWQWYEAGIPILRTRYIEFMNNERSIFIPISFLVSAIVLFSIFRQYKIILVSFIAILTTLIWIAGIMSLLKININVVSYLTFNLLMIIGASNSIHILMKYHEGLYNNLDQEKALKNVIGEIGSALFLTSFTTAVGFCSLVFTNIKITQEFGLLVGFGVILMFILTIIIMPILLSFISQPNDKHINRLIAGQHFKYALNIDSWNMKYPFQILFFSLFLFVLAVFGLSKMNYNASVLEDLRPGNPIYDGMHYVEKKLGGTLPLEVVIDSKEEMGVLEPVFLNKINKFNEFILQIPQVSASISPSDYIMLINQEIGSGNKEIPLAFDDVLSLVVDNEYLKGMVNENYSKVRISSRISDIPYEQGQLIKNNILEYGNDIFKDTASISVTGSTLLSLSTNRHLVKNLTTSFIIAFIIIFLSIVVLFRSFRLSILSMLPNIIPLVIAGGIMGYIGIKLRPSTAMTFSIALGIAVDNTIHFLARFRQEYKKNANHEIAVSQTLLTTGKAIINTGLILSLGFMVLYFSEFIPNHEFGLLATIIIISAIAGSLILLPVLIIKIKPKIRFASNENN